MILLDGNREIVALARRKDHSDCASASDKNLTDAADDLGSDVLTFSYRLINFEHKQSVDQFLPIKFQCDGLPYDQIRLRYASEKGRSDEQRLVQRERFGFCELAVPRKSVVSVLVYEVLNPFYIFQVAAFALWMWD